jgi:integrase
MLSDPFAPIPGANYLSGLIRRRIRQLGLVLPDGVSHGTHGFRHAFASRMVGEIPFKDLVDQLGHRDPASTLIYSKVDLDGLRQATLPWPGGGQ